MTDIREFECALCGETLESGWTEEEAKEEVLRRPTGLLVIT